MNEPFSFGAAPEPCPSDDAVLALVCGQLKEADRARVLRHAERCESCALVVAEAGLALGATERDPTLRLGEAARAVFESGQLVASRYRIERRLGQGGMGEVYVALDRELDERVALKTIAPALSAEPRAVERLKLELRLARRVSHPHVCRVFELGRHPRADGSYQWFFTMQLIDGPSLRRQLVRGGPPSLAVALLWAEQLAAGLAAIHAEKVVHRDIKPENVMLASGDESATAIWVDFGLARIDLRDTSSPGLVQGTPDYAAPELLRGAVASRASDLYAFGVLLYELLTGALPFPRAAGGLRGSPRSADAPLPPSALRRGVPPDLDTLVLQCLEEAAERRPLSARRLADQLRELQARAAPLPMARPLRGLGAAVGWLALATAVILAGLLGLVGRNRESLLPAAAYEAASVRADQLDLPPTIASTPPGPVRVPETTLRTHGRRSPAPEPPPPVTEPPVTDFGGRR